MRSTLPPGQNLRRWTHPKLTTCWGCSTMTSYRTPPTWATARTRTPRHWCAWCTTRWKCSRRRNIRTGFCCLSRTVTFCGPTRKTNPTRRSSRWRTTRWPLTWAT
uniref:(northern house mosquito) hypothetical protein n=1 Tax=Culex pipiens TaxID=7175 RepID=A0A8D8GV35_CULPI